MKTGKIMIGIIVLSLCLTAIAAKTTFADPPKSKLAGTWMVQYTDGSAGTMMVQGKTFNLSIPKVGEIKGMIQESGEYFESILSDRRNGINFIFGYIKGDKLEGKLQENMPCPELNKAFKNNVIKAGTSSCQAPFTAVKK